MNKKSLAVALACLALAAQAVSHNWHYQKDLIDHGETYILTQWKLVDKGWRPKVRPGRKWHGDFYPFNEHFDKWVIISTNCVVRPLSVKAHSKYLDRINELEPGWKKQKELEKAAIRFGKNLEKERKNFEKYRDKAGTQEEAGFWQTLLDVLPTPNESTP